MKTGMFRIFRMLFDLMPFCLVLSTVFVIDDRLVNGVVYGKYCWFYAAMGFTSVCMLVSYGLNRKEIRFSIDDGLAGLFCLSGLIITFIHTGAFTTKWILLLLIGILYVYFRIGLVRHKRYLPLLVFFLIITGLVEAVWGMIQLYGFSGSQHSLFKTTGSFFNPGPYAGYLAVVFPLALYHWINSDGTYRRLRRGVACLTCIAILLILPATMSRASWLAATGGSLLVGFDYLRHRISFQRYFRQHRQKIKLLAGIAIILLAMACAGVYHLKKDSADGRVLMWKIALRAIPHYPWGVGLGHFSGAYGEEQALYFASGQTSEQEELVAGSPEYGFNEYLQICIEWGAIPFLLFLVMMVRAVYTGYKQKQIAVTAALLALLIFAGMSYPFSVLPFAIVLVFLLAAIRSPGKPSFPARSYAVVLLSVLICGLGLYNRYPVYRAYRAWTTERVYYNIGLYEDVAENYRSLYPVLNDQIHFLFEYAQSLSKSGQYAESNEVLEKAVQISCDPMLYMIMGKNYQALKEYRQAEACFINASNRIPHRLYPFYLLTKLYYEMGLQDKVNEMADIVRMKEPKVQSTAIREMKEEVEKLKTKS